MKISKLNNFIKETLRTGKINIENLNINGEEIVEKIKKNYQVYIFSDEETTIYFKTNVGQWFCYNQSFDYNHGKPIHKAISFNILDNAYVENLIAEDDIEAGLSEAMDYAEAIENETLVSKVSKELGYQVDEGLALDYMHDKSKL